MGLKEAIAKTLFGKYIDDKISKIKQEYELKSYAIAQQGNGIDKILQSLLGEEKEPELIINYMIFSCLSYTIEETSKIRINCYRNGEIDENSEIQIKLDVLNPLYSSQSEFIGHIVLSLIYKGIAYILNDKNYFRILKPQEMEEVEVDQETGIPKSYKYKGKVYYDKDLIVIKFINNPEDPTKPYSVFDAIESIAKLTDKGIIFLRNFFEEGGFLPGFFKSTSTIDGIALSTDKYDFLKEEQLFKKVMKRVKRGQAGILPPNYDYIPAGTSLKDSLTIEIMQHVENIIASAFNIPKSIIGKLTSGGSYSLTSAERKLFYDIVIDKYINKIENAFTTYARRYYDKELEVKRDVSKLSYLKVYVLDYATPIAQLVGSGVITPNEARQRFFDLEPIEGGDGLRVGRNNVIVDGDSTQGNRSNPKKEGDEKRNDTDLKMLEKSDKDEIEELEKMFQQKISFILDPLIRDLTIDIKELVSRIQDSLKAKEEARNIKLDTIDVNTLLFYIMTAEDRQQILDRFANIMRKYYKTAFRRASRILSEIYENVERDNDADEQYAEFIEQQVEIAKQRFDEDVFLGAILFVFEQNKNAYVADYVEILKEYFNIISKWKPKTWAITEMQKIFNEYVWDYAKKRFDEGALIYKAWRSMRDERVREAHRIADNNKWIPLDQKFELTTAKGTFYADRPHDPTLPPELVINCRCFLILKNL